LAIRKKEQELGVNADIQREKTYGGKFEGADTGITGQADFVGWGRNEGGDFSNLVVRDYKFSNDDSVETLA